jgi:hypothetical protein
MNDPFIEARQLFPNMPEELFTLWLDEIIKEHGLPPHEHTIWDGVFRFKPLDFLQRLTWTREEMIIDFSQLTCDAQRLVKSLIEAYFLGIPNPVSVYMGEQSTKKFRQILEET